jgi:hypothetical protein
MLPLFDASVDYVGPEHSNALDEIVDGLRRKHGQIRRSYQNVVVRLESRQAVA